MAERKQLSINRRVTARYFELVRRFPLLPIRNDRELDQAMVVINELLDQERLDSAESDYLDVLSDLVGRYEDETHAIDTSDLSDAEMLSHLIEAKSVSQADVSRDTGIAESTISEVLSSKRQLSRGHIATLAGYFSVKPGVFRF